jgi:hypothetical protein
VLVCLCGHPVWPATVRRDSKDVLDDVPDLARGLELEARRLLLFWLKHQHPRTYPLIFGKERPSVVATEPEPTLFDDDSTAIERYRGLPMDQRQTIGRVIDAFWEMRR